MKVLADTGAWVALSIAGDRHHAEARAILEGLEDHTVQFVVTDYILDETLTLVRLRSGHHKAVTLGRQILDSRSIHMVMVNEATWNRAWEIFQHYRDKAWSFTDCTSFAVMDSLGIQKAFAFDKNFLQYGKDMLRAK